MRVITPNATYIQRSDLYYLDMVRFPIPADLRDKYDQDTRKREYDYQPQPIDTTKFYKISNAPDKKYVDNIACIADYSEYREMTDEEIMQRLDELDCDRLRYYNSGNNQDTKMAHLVEIEILSIRKFLKDRRLAHGEIKLPATIITDMICGSCSDVSKKKR